MAIRVSGLVSGLDTDSIVQELVAAYSTKKDKHVKAQTKLEWKMDAWKDLNKKVNSLYKKLGNMKLSSYYNKKTTTVSDPTKATVMASNGALNGVQNLEINHVATTGYLTGAQLAKGTTNATTLEELGMSANSKGTIALAVNGSTTNIEISSDMTVADFTAKLQDAGVSASFDQANGRMYISAKKSGEDNDFGLTAVDQNGLQALKSMGVYVQSAANDKAYEQWMAYTKKPDGTQMTDAEIEANFADILSKIETYQGDNTVAGSIAFLEEKNADYKTQISNLQADRNFAVTYIGLRDSLKYKVDEDGNPNPRGLSGAEQDDMERMLYKTDEQLKADGEDTYFATLKAKGGFSDGDITQLRASAKAVAEYQDIAVNPSSNAQTAQDVIDAYKAGTTAMQAWVDQNSADIQAVSNDMKANAQEIADKQAFIQDNALLTGAAPNDPDAPTTPAQRAKVLMGKLQSIKDVMTDTDYSDAKRIDGTKAQITLNGVTYESDSNDITVNGMTITALQETKPGESITVNTQVNVQGIYDSIKDFFKEYNALIKEMDELYNAGTAKGYEPLTDEEKDAMTDKEIEKWEEKIKKSILRRDDTLSSVMNLMTSSMSQGITLSDGKKYSLASFGIKTQGYLASAENEGYCYHIDGDSEDEVSAGNNGGNNALMAAIQSNPEMVQEFFQKLSDDLYTKLDKKMQSTTMNSKFSIYNDKKMQRDYDEYTKTIKKWEDKVTQMEEYYYNKFAAMEKALSTLQNSTSALGGLLGS